MLAEVVIKEFLMHSNYGYSETLKETTGRLVEVLAKYKMEFPNLKAGSELCNCALVVLKTAKSKASDEGEALDIIKEVYALVTSVRFELCYENVEFVNHMCFVLHREKRYEEFITLARVLVGQRLDNAFLITHHYFTPLYEKAVQCRKIPRSVFPAREELLNELISMHEHSRDVTLEKESDVQQRKSFYKLFVGIEKAEVEGSLSQTEKETVIESPHFFYYELFHRTCLRLEEDFEHVENRPAVGSLEYDETDLLADLEPFTNKLEEFIRKHLKDDKLWHVIEAHKGKE